MNPAPRKLSPSAHWQSRQTESEWASSPFSTISSSEAFLQRLRFIKDRLAKETWLPTQFSDLFYSAYTRVLAEAHERPLSPLKAQEAVEWLASLAYCYDDLTLKSSTLCQIRALDMELNEGRYKGSPSSSAFTGNLSA